MSTLYRLREAQIFTSLRHYGNYRLYFIGQFISQTGSWLQSAAQSWLILQLTHSALAVAALAFWQFGPYSLLGLFGGVFSDRLDRRKTLIVTQSAFMLCAAGLGWLTLRHVVTVDEVYAIAAARGFVLVLNNPSQQAFVVQMVGRRDLPNAIALNSGIANATRIIGPGVAGLLIATLGIGWCFALNAVSYLAVIAALMLMRVGELYPIDTARIERTMVRGIREGLRFARQTPAVLYVLMILLVISTVSINFNVLLPVLALQTLRSGPQVFGLLTSFFGAGALVGALLSASLSRANWRILLFSALLFGLMQAALGPLRQVLPCIILLVATGICYTLYTSVSNAMVQLATPDELQGRVGGLYSYIFAGPAPAGALLAGWLCDAGGTRLAFIVAGAAAVLMALWGYFLQSRGKLAVQPAGTP